MQSADGPVMGCCEHGNEKSVYKLLRTSCQAEQISVFQEWLFYEVNSIRVTETTSSFLHDKLMCLAVDQLNAQIFFL